MALPEGMSEFEHLQSVVMHTYNPIVQAAFRDDIPENDINTPESALKYACLIKDEDTAAIMAVRMLEFYFTRGELDIADKLYAVPILDHHRSVRFAPQITLKFKETKANAKLHNRQTKPKRMQLSFRIPALKETTVTTIQIEQWTGRFKQLFPSSYYHVCGNDLYTYKDENAGLKVAIESQFKGDAGQLAEKVCEAVEYIREHSASGLSTPVTYKAQKLRKHSDDEIKPEKETIDFPGLNEKFIIGTNFQGTHVYLTRAELQLHGRLINKTLIFRNV
jgi:hypothetical protein